ncbi:MAG: tryptophan--tRNA ligase [Defluviitaleaceae bacterium]|nr:tryptophan--tRNA ligase [Defluviitaleaceae bacterium]
MSKQTIFSGIQPTGIPTLGSLLGAIKHWERLSTEYTCLYCVVDMHSITVRQNPEELRANTRQMLAWLIALDIDPSQNILYIQSQVPAHAELSWILNCFTYMGELSRMTQFKEKSIKKAENTNAGLFTYPVLMAADILLYQTNLVPVGDDQKQHLELSRDVAGRFNKVYGDIFKIPEPYIATVGARIMGLQNPTSKMSKSEENINDTIFLSDPPNVIIKKFKKAVTDSDNQICVLPEKPGVSNLLSIYSVITGTTLADCEKEFEGQGYGHFKTTVGEAVADLLLPYQKEQARIIADTSYLTKVAEEGAAKARELAATTLAIVKNAVGFQ